MCAINVRLQQLMELLPCHNVQPWMICVWCTEGQPKLQTYADYEKAASSRGGVDEAEWDSRHRPHVCHQWSAQQFMEAITRSVVYTRILDYI